MGLILHVVNCRFCFCTNLIYKRLSARVDVWVCVSEVVKPTSMKRIVLGLLNEYGCNDDDLAVDDLAPNVT